MEKKIQSLEDLGIIAREVLTACALRGEATVIALTGDLGAGKTALVKEFGKILGVREEITSPTFVVMKSYTIPSHPVYTTLTHIDAYRIESDDEMRVLGFAELLKDKMRLICIEWPEKIQNLIPNDTLMVTFVLNNDGTRNITMNNQNIH